MTIATQKAQERDSAIASLRQYLNPGDTIYTVLKHRSTSGMYRVIDLYAMQDNEPVRISWEASKLLEGYDTRHEGCKASGTGMDMGFHLVYNLSHALFPDGFDCISILTAGCPANDHSNRRFFEDRGESMPTHHRDGGYALRHRWL